MKKLLALLSVFAFLNIHGQNTEETDGSFYKNLEDFKSKTPANDYKIKSGSQSFNWGGESVKLTDKSGNTEKENLSKFESMFFTYCAKYDNVLYLYKVFKGYSHKVILVGNISLYTFRKTTGNGGEKDVLYYSEASSPDMLIKFKESDLEEWLEKANLLEEYKKDKPKREFKDSVSDFYNKEVARYIKYIQILNKKK